MATRTITSILRAETAQYKRAMEDAAKATEAVAKSGVGTEQQYRKMEQAAAASAAKQKQAWTQVGGALVVVGGSITALMGSMLKTGIAYNQLQQSSRAALTTLTGSAQAANAQMDELDDFARNSPFAKQVFIQAQQQMLGFGIEAQKVIPYLDAIQQSVAATGGSNQDIAELSRIMSQISASAKITATDLREFGNRGIDAATLIGSQMGMTGAQIRDSITDGSLDAGQALDALAAGMQERFNGAADNVKNTFSGAVDRVMAAWRDLSSELAEPLVGKESGGLLVGGLNSLADSLRGFQDLPGPIKATVAALSGITGVGTLAAGTFLMLAPRIAETKAALEQMGPVANGAAGALGKLAKLGAVVGVLTAMYQAGSAVTKSFDQAAPAVEEMTSALLKIGEGRGQLAGLEEALGVLGDPSLSQNIGNLYGKVPLIGQAFADIAPGLRGAQKDLRESSAAVGVLDEALAKMVREGSPGFAKEQLDALLSTLSKDARSTLLANLPEYDAALLGVANSSKITASATEEMAASFDEAVDSMRAMREEAVRAANAEVNYYAAIDDATNSLQENGKTLDLTTEAGRANKSALNSLAAAWNELSDDQQNANGAFREARERLISVAEQMGMTKREARAYADELMNIPTSRTTQIKVETGAALTAVDRMRIALAGLKDKSINIRVTRTGVSTDPGGFGPVGNAAGGYITGPGTATSDSIPAYLSNGEYVIKAAAVEKYGTHMFDSLNAMRFADGGQAGGGSRGLGFERTGIRELDKLLRRFRQGDGKLAVRLEKFGKRLDRVGTRLVDAAKDQRDAAKDQLQAARDAKAAYATQVGESFNNDLYGNGLAGAMLQLRADKADSEQMASLLSKLSKQGLDGAAFESLSTSRDLQTATELLRTGRSGVANFEAMFAGRSRAQQALGATAAAVAHPQREINAMAREVKNFNREVRHVQKTVTQMSKQIERIGDRVERGARAGISQREAASRQDRRSRERAGKR